MDVRELNQYAMGVQVKGEDRLIMQKEIEEAEEDCLVFVIPKSKLDEWKERDALYQDVRPAKEEGPQVSRAFRVSDLSDSDLPIIAQVKKIVLNLDSLYKLLGE